MSRRPADILDMTSAGSVADQKNYYELLGVERDASRDDIARAYRNMAQIFHPDSNFFTDIIEDSVDDKHVSIFDRITRAYQTLLDEAKRAAYDKTLLNGTLKDWDFADPLAKRAPKPVQRGSFGSVSSANSAPNAAQEQDLEHDFQPMSEVIRRRRSTWHNLRRVFKLP